MANQCPCPNKTLYGMVHSVAATPANVRFYSELFLFVFNLLILNCVYIIFFTMWTGKIANGKNLHLQHGSQ